MKFISIFNIILAKIKSKMGFILDGWKSKEMMSISLSR